MQALNASPRDTLTSAQVTSLLVGDSVEICNGLELLDANDAVIADLSSDFIGGEVEHHNYASIHGTCRLSLSTELAWTTARVRPYLTLTSGGVSARFNVGVFILSTPERSLADSLPAFDVQGYDKVSLLLPEVGDTYVVPTGTAYLNAAKAAIAAAGAGSRVNFDGTAQAKVLPDAMVWALTSSSPSTWLDVVNDLLAAVGYGSVWVDQDGYFRAEPYATPVNRPVEWAFNVDDGRTSIVGIERTDARDHFDAVNSWKFVTRTGNSIPTEGAGVYTVVNASDGPFSVASLGRTVRRVIYLDAPDQASLVAQGNAFVQQDRQYVRTIAISSAPLPVAGHFDVLTYTDAALGGLLKVQVREWSLPLDGSDMTWKLEVI